MDSPKNEFMCWLAPVTPEEMHRAWIALKDSKKPVLPNRVRLFNKASETECVCILQNDYRVEFGYGKVYKCGFRLKYNAGVAPDTFIQLLESLTWCKTIGLDRVTSIHVDLRTRVKAEEEAKMKAEKSKEDAQNQAVVLTTALSEERTRYDALQVKYDALQAKYDAQEERHEREMQGLRDIIATQKQHIQDLKQQVFALQQQVSALRKNNAA